MTNTTGENFHFSAPVAQAQPAQGESAQAQQRSWGAGIERFRWPFLAGIFLIGLALRVNCLDCYSLWYDEIASVETAQRGLDGIFNYRFGWLGNQTPLHYILVWLGSQPADPVVNSAWVRGFSVLAGALTVPVVYRLGTLLFSRAHGLLAALLTALTPTLLHYSQELRPYSMQTFLTALSIMCLVEAERRGGWLWWAAFTFSTILNLLNAVVTLTLVLPALGLYSLFLGWRLWRARKAGGGKDRRLLYLGLSLAAIGISAIPTLLDIARTPRLSVEAGELTVVNSLSLLVVLTNWFTQLDIGGQLEQGLQLWLLALAASACLLALRGSKHEKRAAVLLILFLVVPWLILSYLFAHFFIVQRYMIASTPFYLLLISYALVHPIQLLRNAKGKIAPLGKGLAALPAIFTVLLFAIGAANYASTGDLAMLPQRPDFREATAYLSARVRPGDAIAFVDQNALGYMSAMFYWRGRPPVPTFDARDPRISLHRVTGDIYWVFSSLSDSVLKDMIAQNQGQYETTAFRQGVAVVRMPGSEEGIAASLEFLVARLMILRPENQGYITLKGSAHQARGQLVEAGSDYHKAGENTNKVLGFEYLRTARGFADRGHMDEAWREAAISKFMWPANPELHDWFSDQLRRAGHDELSRDEAEIARLLRAMP